ncbi:MAG: RadC family protein [Vulcanibacillus sp.]
MKNNLKGNNLLGTNVMNPAKRIDIVSLRMVKENSITYSNRVISSPADSAEIIRDFIEDSDREQMIVCCLDTKNQPTSISIVSIGSLNSAIVHPREVYKTAILSNSSSIIIAHNHPSGNSEPSHEDIVLTNRLDEAGKIIGIKLLDHLIIGYSNFYSFKEEGLL